MSTPRGPGGPQQPGAAPWPNTPPPYGGQPYYPHPYPPAPPPPGGRKGLLIGAIVVVVLLVAGGVTWAVVANSGGRTVAGTPGTSAPPADPLDKAGPLTDADLAKVDTKKLVDESLMAYLQQPVLHTRLEQIWFGQTVPYLAGQDYHGDHVEGGYDYKQQKLNFLDDETLCVDGGKRQMRGDGTTFDVGGCGSAKPLDWVAKVGNGLVPGGLTKDQAQAFVSYLDTPKANFVRPGKPTLTQHAGKQYVRLPVTFAEIDTSEGPAGTQMFIWAFQKTKVDFDEHAFTTTGASNEQTEMVLYLDPKTRLPAYSEQLVYDIHDDPSAAQGEVRRVEYLWDGKLPRPNTDRPGQPQPPSWPAERLKPAGK